MFKNENDQGNKLRDWLLFTLSFYSPKEMEDLILQFDPSSWEKSERAPTLEDLHQELGRLEKSGKIHGQKNKKNKSTSWMRIAVLRFPVYLGGGKVPIWAYRSWLWFKAIINYKD